MEKRQEKEKEKGDFMDLSRKSRRRDGLEFLWSCWGVEGCCPEMVGTCNPPASLRSLDVR